MQQQLKTGVIGKTNYDFILSSLLFLYCAFLPFEEALASSFGSVLRLFGLLIIAYCVLAFFRVKISTSEFRIIAPFLLWIFYSFLSVIWSRDFSWWFYFFKMYVAQMAFVCVLVAYRKKISFEYVKAGLMLGAFLASAFIIFSPQQSIMTADGRRSIVLFGNEFDPNIVASIIMIGIFSVAEKIFSFKKLSFIHLILVSFFSLGLFFTGSRGGVISLVVGLIVLLLLQAKRKETRKRALLLLALCAAIVLFASLVLPEELIAARFSKETIFGFDEIETGSHGRYVIWKHAISLIGNAPLLGVGCGNFFSAIAEVYKECASHNLYILLLVENGVVGFLIFATGIVFLFREVYKRKAVPVFSLLCAVFVMAMTLDTITYKYFWISVFVAIVAAAEPINIE